MHGACKCLVFNDGTKGFDFAASLREHSMEELEFWLGRMRACPYEAGIIQQEIDRSDPHETRGTLWQFAEHS
jgi:hypothetical protein